MNNFFVLVITGLLVLAFNPAVTLSATPTPVPNPTGELRIATADLGTEGLDPIIVTGYSKIYLTLAYDHIVGTTADGELSTDTGIARKWEMSPDALTWTFYIREGIKFHNGDPLTAEDVKFSLERVMGPKATSTLAGAIRDAIKSMETPSPYKLVIHMSKPTITLAHDLSNAMQTEGMVVPKKYIQQRGEDYFSSHPVGSGPYKLAEHKSGYSIKYEAMAKHWRAGIPKYKSVTFLLVPEEDTRIALLKTGEVDIVDVSRRRVAALKKEGFGIFQKKGDSVITVWMSQQWKPGTPTGNIKVRKALNLAINRTEILERLFYGVGELAGSWYEGTWEVSWERLEPYPYDPEQAKRLLAEAGYTQGFEITVYAYSRGPSPEGKAMMEAIAGYWRAIGLKPKVIATDYGTYRVQFLARTLPDPAVAYLPIGNRTFQLSTYQAVAHSKGRFTSTQHPELDALIDNAGKAKNLEEYVARFRKAVRYVYDNYIGIPILETGPVYATKADIRRWNLGKNPTDMNVEDLFTRK